LRRARRVGRPDEVDAPLQPHAIDDDTDAVPVAEFADRAAGERFRADVADARPGRDAAEPGVGQDVHVLAPGQVLERRGHLVGLLHAGTERAAATEDQHVARLDAYAPGSFERG